MKKNGYLLGMAILVIALIFSCGKLPQAEIDAARAAIDSLVANGADKILTEDFEAIQNNLDDALEMIQEQSSKMFKSFGDVKEKLSGVVENSEGLIEKVNNKKEELMAEVRELMAEIGTINNDSKNMIPKTGKISAQQMILRKDAYAVDTALEDVKTMLDENDIIKALDKLKELKEEADRIYAELKVIQLNSKPVKKPSTTKTTGGKLSPVKK